MDLGDSQYHHHHKREKLWWDEPSVVALDRRTDKMIAVGEKGEVDARKNPRKIYVLFVR